MVQPFEGTDVCRCDWCTFSVQIIVCRINVTMMRCFPCSTITAHLIRIFFFFTHGFLKSTYLSKELTN